MYIGKNRLVQEWMICNVLYSNKKRTFVYVRLFLDLFDIRPNLMKEIFLLKRRIKKMDIPAIGHVHIPKTGGTYTSSLKKSLPHVNFSHVLVRKDRIDAVCPVGLVPIKKRKLKSFFLFSNIRNPLNFLISYYHHVKGFEGYNNPNHYDYEIAQKGFDFFLQTIMNRTDKWPSRKFLYPQLFDQEGRCVIDWINRAECLDASLSKLCNNFGLVFTSQERKRVAPKEKIPQAYYSDKLLGQVISVYHREMKLFGYDGFDIITPKIKLMPLERERLKYDYISDDLKFDNLTIGN